jgi:hypothetical protein
MNPTVQISTGLRSTLVVHLASELRRNAELRRLQRAHGWQRPSEYGAMLARHIREIISTDPELVREQFRRVLQCMRRQKTEVPF